MANYSVTDVTDDFWSSAGQQWRKLKCLMWAYVGYFRDVRNGYFCYAHMYYGQVLSSGNATNMLPNREVGVSWAFKAIYR